MKNEFIITAKTVEEAMEQARAKYGDADKELSFEILEMPKKGIFGIGARDARVRVTVSDAEEIDLSDLVSSIRSMKTQTDLSGDEEKPQQNPKQPKPQNAQTPKQPKPQQEQKPQQPKPQQNAKQEQKPQPKPQNAQNPKQPKPQQEQKPAKAENASPQNPAPQPAGEELPAALRRPQQKPQAQKAKPKQKQKQPRPADGRSEAEKKKDLLSAVMDIHGAPAAESAKDNYVVAAKPRAALTEEAASGPVAGETELVLSGTAEAAEENETLELPRTPVEPEPPRIEFVSPEEMECALDFTRTLLSNMGLHSTASAVEAPADVEVPEGKVYAKIDIAGDDTGILIGHHGETLDAIQYLVNLCGSRRSGRREFVKIVVDIENYRAKREETLRALARRMSAKALKYKRNIVLEPMNPYERRIIHSEILAIENVSTHSVGSDENRKIVITYEGPDKAARESRRGGSAAESSAGTQGRRPRRRRPARDAAQTAELPEAGEQTPRRREKPVRAKSIDEVRIDISEDSDATFGSIGRDEGVETQTGAGEILAEQAESQEESLREF